MHRYYGARPMLAIATVTVLCFGSAFAIESPAVASGGHSSDVLSSLDANSPVRALVSSTRTDDQDEQRVSGSFHIGGKLVDEGGIAIANTDVQVDLLPGPDALKQTATSDKPALDLPVGHDVTDDYGVFDLPVPALRNISDYLDGPGNVRLLISSVGPEHSAFYDVSAVLSPTPNEGPTISTTYDKDIIGASRPELARSRKVAVEDNLDDSLESPSDAPAKLDDVLLIADRTTAVASPSAKAAAADPNPAQLCLESVGIHVYGWQLASSGEKVNTAIQAVRTLGRSNSTYNWQDVSTITVTTGWDLAYKATTAKGGFERTLESGIGGSAVNRTNFRGFVETGVEYRWNYLYCYKPQGVYANVRVSTPYQVLGGAVNRGTPRADVNCKPAVAHVDVSPGNSIWVSRAASWKVSASISVGGISLDSSQTNNSSNTMTYSAPGRSTAHFCGNNDTVLKAAVVREANS